jgi:hypothetical protein
MTISSLILPAMLIELFLSATWSKFYFGWGIPIYSRAIPAREDFSWQLPVPSLKADVARRFWPLISFSGISAERCGFRESFLAGFDLLRVPYAPIMRGVIVLDAARREVRILGLCNWYVLFAASFIFGPAVLRDAKFIPIIFVLLGGSYVLQRARFNHVAETVARAAGNG